MQHKPIQLLSRTATRPNSKNKKRFPKTSKTFYLKGQPFFDSPRLEKTI